MKIIADTHCHTIASAHAYSSILENVKEAAKQGLYAIAITDHSTNMQEAPGMWYFANMKVIPRNILGVDILRGIESNVLNSNGELDLPNFQKNFPFKLDWIIASVHDATYSGGRSIEECTQAWLNVSKNPLVNVVGHSGLPNFIYDYETVIPEFGRNGKLVEVNNSSFDVRLGSYENCKKIALLCKKHSVSIVVNSDSHFCMQVGRFDKALALLQEINFPEELVINADIDRFNNYLEKYTGFFNQV